jgi:hypothetical protein
LSLVVCFSCLILQTGVQTAIQSSFFGTAWPGSALAALV